MAAAWSKSLAVWVKICIILKTDTYWNSFTTHCFVVGMYEVDVLLFVRPQENRDWNGCS